MKVKTEAIVLHSFKYGESKMIVDTFTRTHGRLSFAVPLPRSAHSKLKKQYFQPLTLLNIEADIQQQSQLQKISEASIARPLHLRVSVSRPARRAAERAAVRVRLHQHSVAGPARERLCQFPSGVPDAPQ